jgi:ABC-type anion transport system duplicated permease subunit
MFLGVVLGLIQSSDAQERSYSHNYKLHQVSFGIGFVISMFLSLACLNLGYLDWVLGIMGVAIFIYALMHTLKRNPTVKA